MWCGVDLSGVVWLNFLALLLTVAGDGRRVVSSSAAALLPPHEGKCEHQNITVQYSQSSKISLVAM